ncbi:MAG: class I SAM-dependent methyltransferase [Sciscionella sp.]
MFDARHSAIVERARSAMRAKTMRAVEDVVRPYHIAMIDQLRNEVAALKSQLHEDLRQDIRDEADRVIDFSRGVEVRARRDVFAAGERDAVGQTERFVRAQMPHARHFDHPHKTLEYGLSLTRSGGMALEFGVFSGTTLRLIAAARDDEHVYGFDSFKGLPEDWRAGFPAGKFGTGQLPEVTGAELVVGYFDDELPGFLAEHTGPVDFLHIDCDLYSSTCTVLDLVGPRLRSGSIVVFDEYFNFPGWQDHEYRAWQEYAERTGTEFHYEAYTHDNEQVVMRVTTAT